MPLALLTDTTFWAGLAVTGFVEAAGRGHVKGTASGIASAFDSLISVGWSNSAAEYWCVYFD